MSEQPREKPKVSTLPAAERLRRVARARPSPGWKDGHRRARHGQTQPSKAEVEVSARASADLTDMGIHLARAVGRLHPFTREYCRLLCEVHDIEKFKKTNGVPRRRMVTCSFSDEEFRLLQLLKTIPGGRANWLRKLVIPAAIEELMVKPGI